MHISLHAKPNVFEEPTLLIRLRCSINVFNLNNDVNI